MTGSWDGLERHSKVAGCVVPHPASDTYAFRHALTQEALYGDLLPGERAQLHAAFARVLSERPDLGGPSQGATSARLAYHWVEIARQLGAVSQEGDARRALGVDMAFLGDLEAGRRELTEARQIAGGRQGR